MESPYICDKCCRPFESMRDYPSIFIDNFETFGLIKPICGQSEKFLQENTSINFILFKVAVPNPKIPDEVHNQLSDKSILKVIHDGLIYEAMPNADSRIGRFIIVRKDITDSAVNAVLHPFVQDTLNYIGSWVGKEIPTADLVKRFNTIPFTIISDYLFHLQLSEGKKQQDCRTAGIDLLVGSNERLYIQEIARIYYQGRTK